MMKKFNVAIVGATGLVGSTFIKVLEEYDFPINEIVLLASVKSAGKVIHCFGKDIVVMELNKNSFEKIDIALFSAGGDVSRIYAPIAAASGALVIDNSSAFRMDPNVPLVVPEVNSEDIVTTGIIANPNCSTIQSVLPVKALDKAFIVNRVMYSTYQAVSGSGIKGRDDLERTKKGEKPQFYPYNISETCIPEIDVFTDNDYTKEEMKMVGETRKMLHKPDLKISATCVRVPVRNSHAVSIYVELEKNFSMEQVKKVLKDYEGIKLVDNPKKQIYPTSTMSNGNDYVYVGRVRKDLSSDNAVLLYCVADNVRKGAASNAVQIALKVAKLLDNK